MRTFEESWTAWLDGQLKGRDLAEFEASLPDRTKAEAEKRDARKLGAFLRQHVSERTMSNQEFFNHQLRASLTAKKMDELEKDRQPNAPVWPIGRLIWFGTTSLALFFVCAFFVMREKEPVDQSQYLSQILNARVDPTVSPNATVSTFQAKENKATVLWVDGLQSLPPEYATK
jgi:hypothetical protein